MEGSCLYVSDLVYFSVFASVSALFRRAGVHDQGNDMSDCVLKNINPIRIYQFSKALFFILNIPEFPS